MDSGLKQRVIGALVLIVAAVIFLPMLLTGQDETVEVEIEVPEPASMPAPEVAAPPAIEPREPEPVAEMPLREPEPIESTPVPAVEQDPEPAEPQPPSGPLVTAPSEPASVTAEVTGDWVIQLGSFANADNARGFVSTLNERGYNAYARSAETDGRSITRVFVGPLQNRAAAERLRDELKRNHEVEGLVVAHDDDSRRP
ncbi:SPOR domain-containing protein [Halopseudomonas salegens]|uniref:DedD protein n=1 Tax=Halopseudomonas salegens TaxID=1434072 RepID=A0A1H2F2E2_9GAMM|nr:SPOR domain-containing protein [Halopseudomonas salegens]SDU01540.1 DedD protein [Halopseudomonas salegens]